MVILLLRDFDASAANEFSFLVVVGVVISVTIANLSAYRFPVFAIARAHTRFLELNSIEAVEFYLGNYAAFNT